MFERFTDRARTVVVLAQEQARSLSHHYIGTEHLLLGLLAEGNGVAAKVLEAAGITLDRARADVVRIVGTTSSEAPTGSVPFTARAKTALEASLRESLRLGHEHIGTEHILLGIVDEREGLASQILASHGFSPEDTRAAVLRQIGSTEPLSVPGWRGGPQVRQGLARQQNTTPAMVETYIRARELAGRGPISSGHILRALVLDSDSQAARALASLGMSAERIEGALAATSTEGTTDEMPEAAIARIASIQTVEGGVEIKIADADLAKLLKGGTPELTGPLAHALDQLRTSLEREARKAQGAGSASMEA